MAASAHRLRRSVFGYYYLVSVHAHTKYSGVQLTINEDAKKTVEIFLELYAHFGLPSQVVSDKRPAFISDGFANFLRMNGILHLRLSPHHFHTNGKAEHLIATVKEMKCGGQGNHEIEMRSQQFLLKSRTTPHAMTNRAPAEMLFGFRPMTRLNRLRPALRQH